MSGPAYQVIEVIRGLNMGGAETLLYTRLRYSVENSPDHFGRTLVINTLRSHNYYTEQLRRCGIDVVELSHSGPIRGMFELRRLIRRHASTATTIFHSPITTYLEKVVRAFRLESCAPRMVDVVHSTWYRGIYRLAGRWLDRYCDVAVAVSDEVATSAAAQNYRSKIVVFAGVDQERMRAWIADNPGAWMEMRQRIRVPENHRLIVTVGSLIELKGQRYVIEALAHPGMESITLALIGDGSEREQLEQLARDQGVHDRVRFLGRIDDGWQWTAIADAIVHPSAFEGLPVALMEAAALGTPIVATAVGGIPRVVDSAQIGSLISSADPKLISRALGDVFATRAPVEASFATRIDVDTYWSARRYVSDFYTAIGAHRS